MGSMEAKSRPSETNLEPTSLEAEAKAIPSEGDAKELSLNVHKTARPLALGKNLHGVSLLESGMATSTGSLKDRVATCEADMATLNSKISVLENQVSGSTASDGMSLLEKEKGSSLKSRIVALESEADSNRG